MQKGISKAVSSLQEMSETAKTSGREQTESMNALAESTKGVASSIERANSTQKKTYDNLAQSLKNSASEAKKTQNILKNIGSAWNSFFNVAVIKSLKLATNGVKELFSHLSSIKDQSRDLGVSSEYFQKLGKTAEESGVKMDSVVNAFKYISENAEKAIHGNKEAAKAFHNIGIEVDDLKDKSPEQVFAMTAQALAVMGDSAFAQKAKMDICGMAAKDLDDAFKDLADIENKKFKGIFNEETVQSAKTISQSFAELKDSLIAAGNNTGFFTLVSKTADTLKMAVEGIDALLNKNTRKKNGSGMYFEDDDFGKDNKYHLEIWQEDERAIAEARKNSTWLRVKRLFWANTDNSILDSLRDANGLTPGQRKYAASAGWEDGVVANRLTENEINEAKKKIQKKKETEEKNKTIAIKQKEAEKEDSGLTPEKYEEKLREAAMDPIQRKRRDIHKEHEAAIAEAAEVYGGEEKIPQWIRSQIDGNANRKVYELMASNQRAMPPIYTRQRINNAPARIAGNGADFRAMVEQQRKTNDLLAKSNFIKIKN